MTKNNRLFTGTSPQTDTDHNSTLPSTVAHIALALTNTPSGTCRATANAPVKIHCRKAAFL
jgi:N-methylhydantoinase B/oxoprolinase/acetone carboxylase alpha subunit